MTMLFHELTSAVEIQAYVLHGLGRMRSLPLQPAIVHPAIEWMLALAAEGHPLPPPGFVADVGAVTSGVESKLRREIASDMKQAFPAERAYEDYVISKLFGDRSLDRATDALRRFSDQDRPRAISFIVNRIREQLSLGGVMVGVGPVKELLELSPENLMTRCATQTVNTELQQLLEDQYNELISASRLAADLLAPEDVFELERGTAISQLGQRLALRQVIRAASQFSDGLSDLPAPRRDSPDSPTQMLDEDAYPVGGFSAISNRGTTESLLHSQLAYMEPVEDRPDLFDVKFLRDELLYYSRDENQFFRRRRHFDFVFDADLTAARIKDPDVPFQRIIMALAAVVATVRRLISWYCDEAITFELLFPANATLEAEQKLLSTVFRDEIASGTVRVSTIAEAHKPVAAGRTLGEKCNSVRLSVGKAVTSSGITLQVAARPVLQLHDGDHAEPIYDWSDVVRQLANACAR